MRVALRWSRSFEVPPSEGSVDFRSFRRYGSPPLLLERHPLSFVLSSRHTSSSRGAAVLGSHVRNQGLRADAGGSSADDRCGAGQAFYPIEAKQGHIEEVAELVTHERPPPPNPLLRMEYSRLGGAGPVRAEPAQVHFAGLEEGGASLVQSLRLVNSSGNPVRMHIMHPQTPHFAISIGRNGAGKRGRVMPGMAEEVTVVCKPTELRYYRDTIRVHIEGGETMLVPLHAYPAVAEAAFPSIVDFGRILQGQSAQRILPLRSDTERRVRLQGRRRHRPRRLRHRADERRRAGVGRGGCRAHVHPLAHGDGARVIEVHVAQLGFKPQQITLVGSSSATQVKHATLAKLRHQAAVQQQQERERRQQQSHRGALFEAEGDAASGGGALGEDVPGARAAPRAPSNMEENDPSSEGAGKLTHKLKPVLLAEPSLALLEAIAAQPLGGGSGGGDAVTRAMALQLRHTVGDRSIPVKHPIPREPFPEDSKGRASRAVVARDAVPGQHDAHAATQQDADLGSTRGDRAAAGRRREAAGGARGRRDERALR